jgi:hypothetical protein
MPAPARTPFYPTIGDNYPLLPGYGKANAYLAACPGPEAELAIVSAYFSIYAHEKLTSELGGIRRRLLVGKPNIKVNPNLPPRIFNLTDDAVGLNSRLPTAKAAPATPDTPTLERQVATLVDKLYDLTEDKIALVEGQNV